MYLDYTTLPILSKIFLGMLGAGDAALRYLFRNAVLDETSVDKWILCSAFISESMTLFSISSIYRISYRLPRLSDLYEGTDSSLI